MADLQDSSSILLRGDCGNRMLPALGHRERGTLGALLASGKIGGAELLAANRWYEAFALAEHGAFDVDKAGAGGTVKLYPQERQVAAVTSYRMAKEALGQAGDRRMRAILGDGLTMAALARRMSQNPHVMSGRVIADLIRLVEHYTGLEGRRSQRKRSDI